jgi:hypothetical protein
MNETNTIDSDETSNDNELRLSSGSSSDSSYASEASTRSDSNQKQKKRKLKSYKLIEEYDNYNEALNRLKEPVGENTYVFRYTKKTFEGAKDYYFCHGNQQCPKCLYILRHSDSIKSSIWLAKVSHEHKSKTSVLPSKSVAHIKKLFEDKIRLTNNEIIASLRRNNCPQLTKAQINNLKARLRDKRIGAANCCLYELKEWCEKKLLVPRDDDEIFCGGFDYVEEETTLIDLRIFVTTKRLLSHMKISRRESECILFYFLLYIIFYFI